METKGVGGKEKKRKRGTSNYTIDILPKRQAIIC